MAATQSVKQADEVIGALEALRARWAERDADEQDSDVLQRASELIAELRALVSSLDGQLAAMRWLAQKQYRPKSEHVPEDQLALELVGFLMQPKAAEPSEQLRATRRMRTRRSRERCARVAFICFLSCRKKCA